MRIAYTRWFLAEFRELPPDGQVRVVRRIRALERKGWRASVISESVVPLRDGIHELRVVGKGPAFRVLFFVLPGNPGRVLVLTSCVKKASMLKANVKDAEIKRALARREAWLDETR